MRAACRGFRLAIDHDPSCWQDAYHRLLNAPHLPESLLSYFSIHAYTNLMFSTQLCDVSRLYVIESCLPFVSTATPSQPTRPYQFR